MHCRYRAPLAFPFLAPLAASCGRRGKEDKPRRVHVKDFRRYPRQSGAQLFTARGRRPGCATKTGCCRLRCYRQENRRLRMSPRPDGRCWTRSAPYSGVAARNPAMTMTKTTASQIASVGMMDIIVGTHARRWDMGQVLVSLPLGVRNRRFGSIPPMLAALCYRVMSSLMDRSRAAHPVDVEIDHHRFVAVAHQAAFEQLVRAAGSGWR
jgi:hypothetical protein